MPSSTSLKASRVGALAGPAFAVFFVTSVAISSPPADTASDTKWIANYSGHGHQIQHAATGIMLVLAALCLMTFLTTLWRRIADSRPGPTSPLPIVAAGAAAAGIAAGGVLMAAVSASELGGAYPLPGADVLRLASDAGFGLVALGGMWSAALAVVVLSVQGRQAGIFGPRLAIFGEIVAVLLLFSLLFVPIIALLVWSVVVAVSWLRKQDAVGPGLEKVTPERV